MKVSKPNYVIRPWAHVLCLSVEGEAVGFFLERCFAPQVALITFREKGSDLLIGNTFDEVIQKYFNNQKE